MSCVWLYGILAEFTRSGDHTDSDHEAHHGNREILGNPHLLPSSTCCNGYLKEIKDAPKPHIFNDTCWNSQLDCIDSFLHMYV